EAHQGLLPFRREPRCSEKWRQVRRRTQVMVIPLPSPTTTAGAISRATLRAGPVFARCGVIRRSFGMTKSLSSCLASRKNRLRRGRERNGYRPLRRGEDDLALLRRHRPDRGVSGICCCYAHGCLRDIRQGAPIALQSDVFVVL